MQKIGGHGASAGSSDTLKKDGASEQAEALKALLKEEEKQSGSGHHSNGNHESDGQGGPSAMSDFAQQNSGLLGTLAIPVLGTFSKLVGHDGAEEAANNGDIPGWLVNTFDHTSHSHELGGAAEHGTDAPLGILGTIGQEAGNLVGLDKLFGDAKEYDEANGTDYAAHGGAPKHIV